MAYRFTRKEPSSPRTIRGSQLAAMICAASAALKQQEETVNRLNVFPVPDGDTGTNMCLTLSSAATALSASGAGGAGEVSRIAADAMLRGARGNSGVILSLLFRGFAKTLKDKDECSGALLAKSLTEGMEAAYKAVMKPAEGTILTVARMAAEEASKCSSHADVEQVLSAAAAAARRALEKTRDMNPVLRKAGVVDAGGTGWTVILESMLSALQGGADLSVPSAVPAPAPAAEAADFAAIRDEDIRFTYCTEFIAARLPGTDPAPLRDLLLAIGDSMVFIPDDDIIKVHVHTDDPGLVLSEALHYGTLQTVKVENMRLQHTNLSAAPAAAAPAEPAPAPAEPEKACGVVAVCTGQGFRDLFLSLGADCTVTGGQTMNPSTEDILQAVESVNAGTVFVLPNNKNIVMAARQCVSLTGKTVKVIPTATFPQGVAALAGCDLSSGDASAIEQDMLSAPGGVRTAQVTYAARDSEFNGRPIRAGEYLSLLDGELLGSFAALPDLISSLCDALSSSEPDCITIYRGCDAPEGEEDTVADLLAGRFPDSEVSTLSGGQPVYSYIISAE